MGNTKTYLEREMTFKTTKLRDAITFALAVGTFAGSGALFAQEAGGQQEEANELDRVTVTGSRIRQVDAETTSPVLSIDRQDLEATGLTSVGDVLFNITASDGGALRNITTSTNGSDGTQNISLRGLGATRTLVLVNGRRWVTDGGGTVDLNTIPIAVVERIEVLKDGASAVYGSDAIAGVINVITRTNFEGGEARAYLGQYSKGDGFQQAYDFTLGSNTDRVNTVFSVSYTDQEPVFARNRERSAVPVFGGGDLASGGLFGSGSNEYGNFTRCATTPVVNPVNGFRSCTTTGGARTLTTGEDGRQTTDFRPFVSYTTNGSGSSDRYNFAPVNYLLQPIERFNVYGQGTLRLTDRVNANVMATYVKRRSVQQLAEVPLTMDIRGPNGRQWAFAPSGASVFNPFGTDIRNFNFRARAVGPRQPNYDNDNIAFTGWLDGSFDLFGRGMYWDAGYSFLESKLNSTGRNYVNLFNLQRAVGPSRRNPVTGALECLTAPIASGGQVIPGCVPYNVFGGPDLGLAAGVINQAEFDAMNNYIRYTKNDSSRSQTDDYFANLSGDIVDLPAGPLGFAVGVELRRNSFENNPDSLVQGGGSSDNFSLPTTGETVAKEYYAELNIPILADVPGFELLEVNIAARRSEYDASGTVSKQNPFTGAVTFQNVDKSFGDTSTKVGLKWKVFSDLMIRGTYSESFRAPSVTDLFQGIGESFPIATDPCNTSVATGFNTLTAAQQARCLQDGVPVGGAVQSNSQIRSLVGGNPDLLPEFGETRTVGLVYSPSFVQGLDFTLDYFNIKLEDAIAFRGTNTMLNLCYRQLDEFYCQFTPRDPANGQLLGVIQRAFNLTNAEVEGYDFTVNYRMPETSFGRFAFQWDNTYQTKNDLFGRVGEYNGTPTFRLRSNLTTTWQMGDFDATWAMRYYSALDEDCSSYAGLDDYGITPTDLCNNPTAIPSRGITEQNRLGSVTYHDVQVGWKTPWNGKVAIGGRNVFGKEPPIARNTFAHSFDAAYDLPGGGFYYLQYSQKF
jgi:iron complex outermembrane recepter protein